MTKTVTLTTAQIPSHAHTPIGGGDYVTVDGNYGERFGFAGGSYVQLTWKNGGRTENTGGGGSHNNLQPYQTIYMWRRTS